jgi:hypothetical protein
VSAVNITPGVVLQNIFVSFLLALLFIAFNEGAFLFAKWKQSLLEQERTTRGKPDSQGREPEETT